MSGEDKGLPGGASREARLAAALRENLRRRKTQARGRTDAKPSDAKPSDPKSAGAMPADAMPTEARAAEARDTHER